jgi:asparagine synthetase B (glutamine-hydrolysing)
MSDQFVAIINWGENYDVERKDEFFSIKNISLYIKRNQIFNFDGLGYVYNRKHNLVCAMLGYFSNWNKLKSKYGKEIDNDVSLIEAICISCNNRYERNIFDEMDGLYVIFIYDIKINKVFIFQSVFGYTLPIYYEKTTTGIIIATSLKKILKNSKIKREFDTKALSQFIGRSIIQDEKTLIKSIKKIVTHSYLEIDISQKSVLVHSIPVIDKHIPEKVAKTNLINSIKSNITEIVQCLKEPYVNSTITGGWDSNLIVNTINSTHTKKINAFTIDGRSDCSELATVKKIIQQYNNIDLFTHEIDVNILDFLPDMVWKYEGYVFEVGMFLRYDLAYYLLKNKQTHIFSGCGADPVLDSNMGPGGDRAYEPYGEYSIKVILFKIKKNIKRLFTRIGLKFGKKATPTMRLKTEIQTRIRPFRYNYQVEYNLKMHGILFNAFKISTICPFLNKDTTTAANSLRKFNYKKALYKQQLRHVLDEKISKLLHKSGHVLSLDIIFTNKRDLLISVLNTEFCGKILQKDQIKAIKDDPDNNMAIIMQIAYLYLFEYFFLTGICDKYLDEEDMNITLETILPLIRTHSAPLGCHKIK